MHPVEDLPRRDGKAPLIGVGARPLASRELGRQVAQRAPDHSVVLGARETEVAHLGASRFVEENVLGFEVSVIDARGVNGGEAAPRVTQDGEPPSPRGVRLPCPFGKCAGWDDLHGQEDALGDLPDVEDPDDVRRRHARRELRFRKQRFARLVAIALRMNQLQRNLAIEVGIVRGVDGAHPARAEPSQDDIAPDSLSGFDERTEGRRTFVASRRTCNGSDYGAAFVACVEVYADPLAYFGRKRSLEIVERILFIEALGVHPAESKSHPSGKEPGKKNARGHATLTFSLRLPYRADPIPLLARNLMKRFPTFLTLYPVFAVFGLVAFGGCSSGNSNGDGGVVGPEACTGTCAECPPISCACADGQTVNFCACSSSGSGEVSCGDERACGSSMACNGHDGPADENPGEDAGPTPKDGGLKVDASTKDSGSNTTPSKVTATGKLTTQTPITSAGYYYLAFDVKPIT